MYDAPEMKSEVKCTKNFIEGVLNDLAVKQLQKK